MMEPGKVSDAWEVINWKKVQKIVYRLQNRIYRASKRGDTRTVQSLQRLLSKSRSAKLLATRRVTQENKGKKTAGVDGIKSLKPIERLRLAGTLALGEKVNPLRRKWINKPGKKEQRPLGIPTIHDRATQALAKLAMEPEWEASFEPNSYGFRPGRSAHDAIGQIFNCIRLKPKWVLDADIKGCFDNINHDVLLQRLSKSHPSLGRECKAWLKAGVMDEDIFQTTESGTPQGGVISPLLANIALHGLEEAIKKAIKGTHVIRYADDFVIIHESLESIIKAKEVTRKWLSNVGLELRDDKTRITHTLNGGKDYQTGFDFLGFNVRQYPTPRRRMNKTQRPYKTFIKPSKKAVKGIIKRLGDIIRKNRTVSQRQLIEMLNPTIRGWANFHRIVVSSEIFSYIDHTLYLQLKRWAERRHPLKGKKEVKDMYWHKVGKENWVFGVKQNNKIVLKLVNIDDTEIKRHDKVVGDKSWYDGDWTYWGTRRGEHPMISNHEATLLKKQNGRCSICQGVFDLYDLTEEDHIWPKFLGGKNVNNNLQLLHTACHHAKSRWDEKGYCPIRPWINSFHGTQEDSPIGHRQHRAV